MAAVEIPRPPSQAAPVVLHAAAGLGTTARPIARAATERAPADTFLDAVMRLNKTESFRTKSGSDQRFR